MSHWTFDERRGTSAFDISGNNYTGTLTNGPEWATGKIGQAVNLDGSNDSVLCSDASCGGTGTSQLDMGTKSMTFEAWVKLDAIPSGTGKMVFSKHNGVDTGYMFECSKLIHQVKSIV